MADVSPDVEDKVEVASSEQAKLMYLKEDDEDRKKQQQQQKNKNKKRKSEKKEEKKNVSQEHFQQQKKRPKKSGIQDGEGFTSAGARPPATTTTHEAPRPASDSETRGKESGTGGTSFLAACVVR